MNKSHILLLVSILFSSGCMQTQTETQYVCPDGRTVVAEIAACPPVVTTTQPPAEPLTVEKELGICSEMPSTQRFYFEDYCIIGIAARYENTSICRKVARDQRLSCYTVIAELKGDADVCLDAESQEDQCLSQYATDSRDSSACDKISDINYKDGCYSSLASYLSDPAMCEKIRSVSQKDSCYLNIAMRFGDSSYCNRITTSDQKQYCLQNLQGRPTGEQVPIKM